jgi:hypothetical protein
MMMPKRRFLVLEKLPPRSCRPRHHDHRQRGAAQAYAEMLGVDDYLRKPLRWTSPVKPSAAAV